MWQSKIFLTRALGRTLRVLTLTCVLALFCLPATITGGFAYLFGKPCLGGPFEPYVQAVGTERGYSPGAPSPGLLKFQLVNTVFAYISRYYIDFKSLEAGGVMKDALEGVDRIAPNVMATVEPNRVKVRINGMEEAFGLGEINTWADLRDLLKEVLDFIESSGQCPVPLPELEYAALNGILTAFDPYSKLYHPKDFERVKALGSSSFIGLGIEVEFREGFLTVTQLYEGSPAQKSGLRLGDRIIEVEGDSTRHMSLTSVLSRLGGPLASSVTLSVLRDGEIKGFCLKRDKIEFKSVETRLLQGRIGYLRIKAFQEGTFQATLKGLESLKSSVVLKGLILDLRDNYGGVMEEIVQVADLFLPMGIVSIKLSQGEGMPEFIRARSSGNWEEGCPIVVLIDEGSASGAEIVASALKENGRGLVMGEESFGKACIQQVFALKARYALKLTTAKYFTPLGRYIQSVGLAPDVLLIPIKAGEKGTTMTRRTHYLNEGLVRARVKRPPNKEEPRATLVYLEEGLDRPEGLSLQKGEDYQIQLATRLLEEGFSGGRVDWETSSKVLRRGQMEEERKLVGALERLRIDWSTGPTEGMPSPVASLSLGREHPEVEAGERIEITATVENKGDGTLYRVLGRSSSANPRFDGLEFPIGRVGPGSKVSHTLKVDIPEDSLDRQDEIVVKFREDNGYAPPDLPVWVTTWARPAPLFAYSYRVLDGEGGDGLIQRGEDVELALLIKNVGEGSSKETVVVLRDIGAAVTPSVIASEAKQSGLLRGFAPRNDADSLGHAEAVPMEKLVLHKARVELGELRPGQVSVARFGLSVGKGVPSSAPEERRKGVGDTLVSLAPLERRNTLELEVIMTDLTLGTQLYSRLKLPVVELHSSGTACRVGAAGLKPCVTPFKSSKLDHYNSTMKGLASYLEGAGQALLILKQVQETEGQAEGVAPEPILACRPPTIILKDAVLLAKAGTLKLSFILRDDHVEGAYVTVNDSKVFFKYSSRHAKESTFTAELPIGKGPNIVRVVGYDDQGLSTEKPFVITGR
ncbi:MAG TPA: S41 family peptidase [Candidatus Hypogeohydataceae bacterium YC38]